MNGIKESYWALSLKVKHVAHNNEDAGSTPARPIDICGICNICVVCSKVVHNATQNCKICTVFLYVIYRQTL